MPWDTQIPRTPGPVDKRTSAPASEMLRYANEAAWKAADNTATILDEVRKLSDADARIEAALSDLRNAVDEIPRTTGPDGSPVAKVSDVEEALKNVFRQVRQGFPVTNPGTGG